MRAAVYYLIIGIVGLIAAILGPSLPVLAENTGTLVGYLGVLFTIRSLGGLVGSTLSGNLYDRYAGHVVLGFTLIGLAISITAIPFLRTLWLVWIFVFFWGLGESFLDVGVNTQLLWTFGTRAAPYLNGLHFFFGVGALLAPLLFVQALQQTGGFGPAYWLLAVLMIPAAVWVFALPSPQGPARSEKNQAAPRLNRAVMLICAIFFLYVGAEVSFGGWIYTYTIARSLGETTTAGLLNSAFWGMMTVGRLLSIPAAVWVRPSRLLIAAFSGCLASLGLLTFGPVTPAVVWIGTLALGFSMAPIFPTMLALAGRRMVLTGKTTSWFFIASNAGGMTIPWLTGILFATTGPGWVMPVLLVVISLAVVCFGLLSLVLPAGPRPASEPTDPLVSPPYPNPS
jgi:MFS transporter, FHS family, Na+ dependent glucose transporter 1